MLGNGSGVVDYTIEDPDTATAQPPSYRSRLFIVLVATH